MKLSEKAVETFANSLLECDDQSVEAHGTKGEKNTPWKKKFKNHAALQSWAEKTDGVEVIGVRVVPDEENPANEEDS